MNSPDIATQRFLAANVIYQASNKLLAGDDEADRGVLDDAVLMLDAIASYDTEHDDSFAVEWASVQADRAQAVARVKPGFELDPSVLEAFRWREIKAIFRSLCRQGKFVRQESPTTEWIPQKPNSVKRQVP